MRGGPYLFDGGCDNPAPLNGKTDVRITRLSDIESRDVEWVWPGRIPRSMLTLIEGDPATGKSTLILELAARASRGWKMPDGTGGGEPGTVILLSAEDDPASVIRPRLEAAGADLDRIIILSVATADGGDREIEITDADVARIEAVALEEGAVLVIADPLVAYLTDSTDTNSDHSVRRALRKLKGLAERTGCAVVCVRHWRKSESNNAQYRGGASIAFLAAARAGFAIAYDPDDDTKARRVLACSKMNLAPLPPSLSFQLCVEPGATFPHVEWGKVSRHTADALAGATKEKSAVEEAVVYLEDRLADGPVATKEIQEEGQAEGHSLRSLRRAKERRGIESVKGPTGTFWGWRLPQGGQDGFSLRDGHLPGEIDADLGQLREKGRLPGLGNAAEPEGGHP